MTVVSKNKHKEMIKINDEANFKMTKIWIL
jgi:hypothetical protein